MLIVLNCPGCGKRYEIDGALAGKKSRCKQCGEVFKIPVPTAVSAPAPQSTPPRRTQNASGGGEWHTVPVEPPRTTKPGSGAGPARPSASAAGSGPRTIVLNCPNCQKRYEIDEALAGKKSRCKDCGELFSIPVPRARAGNASRSHARAATPSPPPVWDSVLEDEPTSFKASRGPSSPALDEFDLPPPPRAAYPQPSRKTSGSYRHRGDGPDVGFTIAGCYLALALLVVIGFFIWQAAADPPKARSGQIFAIATFFVLGTAYLLSFCGSIWVLVVAFKESLSQGLLCLLVPCYVLYYIFSRWEDTKGPFVLQLLPPANLLVLFTINFAIGGPGKMNEPVNIADAEAQPEAIPA
jgi:predicted Zn finger-like uncharacterized protein